MTDGKMTPLVLTLIGQDQPGLVERVARAVRAQGGNWLESRMTRLADHFAGILRAEVPAGQLDALQKSLSSLSDLSVHIHILDSDPPAKIQDATRVELEVTGYDRPGIVQKITQALATRQVNIEQMDSDLRVAAMSGEHTFDLQAQLLVGADFDLDTLQNELERIGADLQVDITLQAVR